MLSVGVKVLEKSFALLGVGTEPGRDVLDALKRLSKHVPAGDLPSGVENNAAQGIMDQNKQNSTLMALMKQRAAGVGASPPPGGAAPPGGGGMPMAA